MERRILDYDTERAGMTREEMAAKLRKADLIDALAVIINSNGTDDTVPIVRLEMDGEWVDAGLTGAPSWADLNTLALKHMGIVDIVDLYNPIRDEWDYKVSAYSWKGGELSWDKKTETLVREALEGK